MHLASPRDDNATTSEFALVNFNTMVEERIEECTTPLMVHSIIHLFFSLFLLITIGYTIHQFIREKRDDPLSKCTNICMITFLICSFLSIGLGHLYCTGVDCYQISDAYLLFELGTLIPYSIQQFLLAVIFFEKCYCLFQKSGSFRYNIILYSMLHIVRISPSYTSHTHIHSGFLL